MRTAVYDWACNPKGTGIVCFTSHVNGQVYCELVGAEHLTECHPVELEQATKEINAILDTLRQKNHDPTRELAFIRTPDGPFIVWTRHVVSFDDDEDVVYKALGIK